MDSGRIDIICYYSTSLSTHAVHLLSPITQHFLHCVVVCFLSSRKWIENQFLINTYFKKSSVPLQSKCEISGAKSLLMPYTPSKTEAADIRRQAPCYNFAFPKVPKSTLSPSATVAPAAFRLLLPSPSVAPPVGWAGLRGLSLRVRGLFTSKVNFKRNHMERWWENKSHVERETAHFTENVAAHLLQMLQSCRAGTDGRVAVRVSPARHSLHLPAALTVATRRDGREGEKRWSVMLSESRRRRLHECD